MDTTPKKAPGNIPAVMRAAIGVGAVAAVFLLAWRLADVLLLMFGSVIVATILLVVAGITERFTPLDARWSKAASWLLLLLLMAGFVYLVGAQVVGQVDLLASELPRQVTRLGRMFGIDNLADTLSARLADLFGGPGLLGNIADYAMTASDAIGASILVTFAGIFLAVDPMMYRRGILELLPDPTNERVGRALDHAGQALRLWLIGKLIAMATMGVATAIGLYFIGVPSALTLGVIAGVAEFIPFLGPILSAVPALLLALSHGPGMVAWVLGLYVALHLFEGNVLVPLVQQRTADLPPVLGIFTIIVFLGLFGFAGAIVATPLTLVILVMVKQLYVRDQLGHETRLPGEHPERQGG